MTPCQKCQREISNEALACPHCGEPLDPQPLDFKPLDVTCGNCHRALKPGWQVCPYCWTVMPAASSNVNVHVAEPIPVDVRADGRRTEGPGVTLIALMTLGVLAFGLGTSAGFIVGQYKSGIYTDKTNGRKAIRGFIAENAGRHRDGRYVVVCNQTAIVIDPNHKAVDRHPTTPEEEQFDMGPHAGRPIPVSAMLTVLFGSMAGAPKVLTSFSEAWSKASSATERTWLTSTAIFGTISGFGLGYRLGFSKPGCGEDLFQNVLADDKSLLEGDFPAKAPQPSVKSLTRDD